jgi:ATP/maltotriose-dependent transcriptional regulator MalT
MYTNLGAAQLLSGDPAAAVTTLEHNVSLARNQRARLWEGRWLAYLAEAYLATGDARRARASADEAVAAASDHGARVQCECAARLSRARVLLATEGAAARNEIESELAEMERLIEKTGAVSYTPFLFEERARLSRMLGDHGASECELRKAHRLFVEMGAAGHAERLARDLGLPATPV